MPSPSRTRPAFTLVEVLLVLVIMGVVMALGLPRIDVYKYRADANAITVRSLLMQAQRDAIVRQHDLVVSFDTARARIILGYDQNNDGNIASTERLRMQSLPEQGRFLAPRIPLAAAGYTLTDYGSIRADGIKTISGLPSVTFRRDGSASSALQLYVSTRRPKETDLRVVTVVQATGRTEVQRFTGQGWVLAQ